MKRLTLPLLVLGLGCATTPRPPATADDAADQLRLQIAQAPDDIRRGMLEDELAKIELQRARQANTVLAYRRFLAEFPNGDEAATAKVLLEDLCFQEAEKVGTHQVWEDFLAEHPRGKHAADAREHLGSLEIDVALKSTDLDLIHRTLARFPEHPHRDALVGHEDDLAWEAASHGGIDAIDAYDTAHPTGRHRLEAAQRRDKVEQQEILDAEDLTRARTRAAAADATERRRATVAQLRLNRALATLDLKELRALAANNSVEPSVVAIQDRARSFLDSWTAHPPTPEEGSAIDRARPGAGLRTHDDLLVRVRSGDPTDQVSALHELVEWAEPSDIDVVLKVLDSHYVSVQLAAVEALRSYAGSLKPAVWRAIARAREEESLARASDASWRRVAALRDASNRGPEALDAWREDLHANPDDLIAQVRVFMLVQTAGDRLATGAAARELAKAAIGFGDRHDPAPVNPAEQPPPDPGQGEVIGLPSDLSAARQICTAVDLAQRASVTLGLLTKGATADERELIQLAKTDADNAIARLRGRQYELEQGLIRNGVHFTPCEADLAAGPIAASRTARARAIGELGRIGDPRLHDFIAALQFTPSSEVRNTARQVAQQLAATSQR